jgi:hypothetical protein
MRRTLDDVGPELATAASSAEVALAVRRILNLAHQDWNWLHRFNECECSRNPSGAFGS